MQRGDRRLDRVLAATAEREGTVQRRPSLLDLALVPERAVLLGQQHHGAVGEAGLAAAVVQLHQRQQGVDLGLVGHQFDQRPPQPDRLGGELVATAVALVEDQVDDRQHRLQPLGQEVVGGDPEGDPGVPDLSFRPHQALRHRRLRDEEGAGDLGGAEAAQGPQRQRHLGLGPERRVAAGEDELQALVGEARVFALFVHGVRHLQQSGLRGQRAVAADAVDREVAAGRDQPGARVGGLALARPALGGDGEGGLGGFLGEVDVAEEADQGGEDPSPLAAEDALDQRATTGRTSIAPPRRAAGMRAAISRAPSRSSASSR